MIQLKSSRKNQIHLREVYILTYMLEKCSMKEKTKENQVEEKENIIKI